MWKSCISEEYLILLNICLDKMITNAIVLKGYEKACRINRSFTLVCNDLRVFFYNVYKCSSFPENEVLLKVEEIVNDIDAVVTVYVYCLKCKEKRIIYKSGHSENIYIRSMKDHLREQKKDEWIHYHSGNADPPGITIRNIIPRCS